MDKLFIEELEQRAAPASASAGFEASLHVSGVAQANANANASFQGPFATTLAIGEEEPFYTTMACGEELISGC